MPDLDRELIARLDALGERAGAGVPPMPAAVASAVAARGVGGAAGNGRQSVPLVALAAAVAVIVAGAALVAVRAPVVTRGMGGGAVTGVPGAATLLAMTERFAREGSIDAALAVRVAGGGQEAVGPVYRAMDARTGLLPE